LCKRIIGAKVEKEKGGFCYCPDDIGLRVEYEGYYNDQHNFKCVRDH
jgi:hypothetical protein